MKNYFRIEKTLMLLFMLCLFPIGMLAQNVLKGTVSDAGGEPIIGASVREVGTSNGTVTDISGQFSINVPVNAKLAVSYVGFITQQVNVAGRKNVAVILADDTKSLSDVVVIGYGTQKKADLSSSIAILDAKEITKVPGGLSAGLQSSVPGVQVTNGRIHIRGVGSINNTDPLYVVDGMIGGAVPDENNIASIQILKDAASCAIYGARGANGVIVITTKRGQAGKVKIYYNYYLVLKGFTHEIHLLSGKYLSELINEEMYNHDPTRKDYMAGLSDPDAIGEGYNMFKAITHTGSYQKHNVSISGGSKDANFTITGIYGKDNSLYINEGS